MLFGNEHINSPKQILGVFLQSVHSLNTFLLTIIISFVLQIVLYVYSIFNHLYQLLCAIETRSLSPGNIQMFRLVVTFSRGWLCWVVMCPKEVLSVSGNDGISFDVKFHAVLLTLLTLFQIDIRI